MSGVGGAEIWGSRWRTERGAWRHSNTGEMMSSRLLSWCGWEQIVAAQQWEQMMASGLLYWYKFSYLPFLERSSPITLQINAVSVKFPFFSALTFSFRKSDLTGGKNQVDELIFPLILI